jgi:hypothetical protein
MPYNRVAVNIAVAAGNITVVALKRELNHRDSIIDKLEERIGLLEQRLRELG